MDRTTTIGGNTPVGVNTNPLSNPATSAKIENAAQTAHQTVDKVADKATAQVDRLSGAAHRAVDGTADAAAWASSIPEQAKQVQSRVTDVACQSIRAHPLYAVAGAVTIGYLLGRLARL